jgi:hypothetical protein
MMRRAWIVISAMVASLGLAQPALPQDSDEEIVSWFWTCGIQFKNELGAFYGRRVLTDDGKIRNEDSASWEEANYGRNTLSLGIGWYSDNGPQRVLGSPLRPLETVPGSLSLNYRSQTGVPKNAILRLRRTKGFYKETGLTIPFDRGAAKDLAMNSILLDSVLAFGHDRDELFWTIEDLKPKYEFMPVVAEGTLDMKKIRAAQLTLGLVVEALNAEQADYRTKCSRQPEYYDPNSEI